MSSAPLLDYIAAEQDKRAVLDTLEAVRADYVRRARETARAIYARTLRPISIVDVRLACPPPPEADGRVMGCILRAPEWRCVGETASGRRVCHNRHVRLFVRVKR